MIQRTNLSGFRRGAIDVHDMRIEAKNSKIMHYDDFQDPVITCSLQQEPSSGRHYLFSGTSAGNICVFDPRMFQVRFEYFLTLRYTFHNYLLVISTC